ncbi:hypothetical protein [Microvirga sp. KLBC 81]|uniref:hypothetical protein n=1 Tax=Microvirga sp. KLBC 81 TaxID=1862707 RepID=UPI0010576791|nr:hypothetical protein [Microvirga sp. KLBC 81]
MADRKIPFPARYFEAVLENCQLSPHSSAGDDLETIIPISSNHRSRYFIHSCLGDAVGADHTELELLPVGSALSDRDLPLISVEEIANSDAL